MEPSWCWRAASVLFKMQAVTPGMILTSDTTNVFYICDEFWSIKRSFFHVGGWLGFPQRVVLVDRSEDPGVLRLTKESVNSLDERVCHAVTTSAERLRSSLTARGLCCTQQYCACVCVCVCACVCVCMRACAFVCWLFGWGFWVRATMWSHLTVTCHWQQMFTQWDYLLNNQSVCVCACVCVCVCVCLCVCACAWEKMSYWSKAQIWGNSARAHRYMLSKQTHLQCTTPALWRRHLGTWSQFVGSCCGLWGGTSSFRKDTEKHIFPSNCSEEGTQCGPEDIFPMSPWCKRPSHPSRSNNRDVVHSLDSCSATALWKCVCVCVCICMCKHQWVSLGL